MNDRYQEPGVMPTNDWFAALLRGVDGPLGDVLDVGCAEGVMCALALQHGAGSATGIDTNAERIAECGEGDFLVADAASYDPSPRRTVILSQIIHWIGPEVTSKYVRAATRNLLVIFRTANDHYLIPDHGTWFPTLAELDAAVGGVRTHEELVLTQDNGKEIWAAAYRTDLRIEGETVVKHGRRDPLRRGFDLHGDAPFRPTHRPLVRLSGPNATAVRNLVTRVAQEALADGTYPSDFSPRNVIVDGDVAHLIDDEPDERRAGTVVSAEFLPIWRATLSTIGLDFSGDLRSLL